MTLPPGDLAGAAIVSGLLLVVLAAAESVRRSERVSAEASRKLVHVGTGAISLALPWLVSSWRPVLALAAAGTLLVLWTKRTSRLPSLHGVARRTRGAEYYPAALFLVFLLAHDRPGVYVAALLVLAMSDAFAALIGSRYGKLRFEVDRNVKSLEGSVTFLVTAFLAIEIPALLLTDLPRTTCVLAALLVAALVTVFEVVSLGGVDNLLIPLGVCILFPAVTSQPTSVIVYQTLSFVAIAILTALVTLRVRSFNVGGILMMVLFLYLIWCLGSAVWAMPIFAGFVLYVIVRAVWPIEDTRGSQLRVRVLLRAFLFPSLVVLAGNLWGGGAALFGPFLASASAVLAFALWNHVLRRAPRPDRWRRFRSVGCGVGAATVLTAVAYHMCPRTPISALFAQVLVGATTSFLNDRHIRPEPVLDERGRWDYTRMVLTAVAAGAVLVGQVARMAGVWVLP